MDTPHIIHAHAAAHETHDISAQAGRQWIHPTSLELPSDPVIASLPTWIAVPS